MTDVELSYTFVVPPEDIREYLTPRSIIEYQGTFDVRSVEETVEGWKITVESERMGPGSRSVLAVTETENGYAYEQLEGGVFETLRTEVALEDSAEDEGETELVIRSSFSFGGPFGFIKDWFGTAPRRRELERLAFNLANDMRSETDHGAESGENEDGGAGTDERRPAGN